MLPMRRAAAVLAALLALSCARVDAVASCADCASGKTCLVEDKALVLTGAASSLSVQFCNFDASKASDYSLTFSLQKPLKCDPNGALLPKAASLSAPAGGCPAASTATPCAVSVTLQKPIDWALVLKNGDAVSVLQAKLSGSDEVVQVAQGTGDAAASGVTADGAGAATVCATEVGVKAARLSTMAACNKVSLCRGKTGDTACTVPVANAGALFVDDVACTAEACAGTVALAHALPCEAATDGNNALLVSVAVANAANSTYGTVATLTAAPAATVSAASGVAVGSSSIALTTDATCLADSLSVTVDGLTVSSVATNNGSLTVSLASKLTATQAGSNLDIEVAQCGVAATKSFTATVSESGAEALTSDSSSNSTGSGTSGDVGDASPTGTQTTQKENASTGLPYGVYIAIAVGVLALIGFAVECVYHRRRHSKEHGAGNDGAHV